MDEENTRKKKPRGDSEILGTDDATGTPPVAANEDAGPAIGTENGDGETGEVTEQREGSLEVKVVIEGVKEVELEDKQQPSPQPPAAADSHDAEGAAVTEHDVEENTDTAAATKEETANPESVEPEVVKPEAIPLPEESAGELDESRSSSPPQQEKSTTEVAVEPTESQEADNETSAIRDGPRLPRSTPRKLRSSSPKKAARV